MTGDDFVHAVVGGVASAAVPGDAVVTVGVAVRAGLPLCSELDAEVFCGLVRAVRYVLAI